MNLIAQEILPLLSSNPQILFSSLAYLFSHTPSATCGVWFLATMRQTWMTMIISNFTGVTAKKWMWMKYVAATVRTTTKGVGSQEPMDGFLA